MNKASETRERRRYTRPQLRTVTIEFGVYGCYGKHEGDNGGKGDAGISTSWLDKP